MWESSLTIFFLKKGVLANIGSGAVPGRLPGKVGSQEVPGTGFRDASLGEPVAVALVAALVLKGAILCVRSSVLAV